MPSVTTALAQTFVAFTIEVDNEFEHRTPHRTTMLGGNGPWLASLAMWWNCMRYVGEEPVGVKELERLSRTKTNLNGMIRWGYVALDSKKQLRATAKGLEARTVWEPLPGIIEKRWEDRFGKAAIDRLRAALFAIVNAIKLDLPDCLPILGYGLWCAVPVLPRRDPVAEDLPLCVLLARLVLYIALQFERDYEISLAIYANVLRVIDEEGIRLRDIPLLSGVSKESIAMAMGILRKKNLADVDKLVRLTPEGTILKDTSRKRLARIEEKYPIDGLAPFTNDSLLAGLEPYPDNWRAKVRKPTELPHFPMVLHRGGYPDGS
jgi:hypothetical protein